MKTHVFKPKYIFILVIAFSFLSWPSRGQENTPSVSNETQALQVMSLTRSQDGYLLELKNSSNKSINGYVIAIDTTKRTVDLTAGEGVVAPGDVAQIFVPDSQLSTHSGGTAQQQHIIILSVTFEDHTSEGDGSTISALEDRRLGVKLQLSRLRPLLEAAIASPDSDSPAVLNRLRAQILSLPDDTDPTLSPYVKSGFRYAREDMLTDIQKLQQSNMSIRRGLIKLNEHSNRRIRRL